jgi:hypothetical protein
MIQPTFGLLDSASFKPRNRLLAALPHDVLLNLRPHLKPVSLSRGRVLCEADEPLGRAYSSCSGPDSQFIALGGGRHAPRAR